LEYGPTGSIPRKAELKVQFQAGSLDLRRPMVSMKAKGSVQAYSLWRISVFKIAIIDSFC
jgi:hypothetical protein